MTRSVSVVGIRVVAVGLAVHLCLYGAQQRRRVDDGALKRPAAEEWITYGLNYGETRYSPLKLIDNGNAARLGLAWTAEVGSGGGAQEATPLISNGVIYAITNWSVVYALDARTGKELWRFDPKVDHQIDQGATDRLCCGVVNRGLALYQGKVFVPVLDGRLTAVDAEGGKLVWQTQTTPPNEAVHHHRGAARREGQGAHRQRRRRACGVRGYVTAYDAETGKQAWRFYTVPGDPAKPGSNKPDPRQRRRPGPASGGSCGGGGTVWDSIAYDPELDLLYIGIGNGSPVEPQTCAAPAAATTCSSPRSSRCSPTPASTSGTTRRRPARAGTTPPRQHMIARRPHDRRTPRKVLMQAPKNGFFYVLDRATGELISAEPFCRCQLGERHRPEDRPADRESPRRAMGTTPVTLYARPARRTQLAADVVQSEDRSRLSARRGTLRYARVKDFAFKIGTEEFTGTGQYQTGVIQQGGPPPAGLTPVPPPPIIGPETGRGVRAASPGMGPGYSERTLATTWRWRNRRRHADDSRESSGSSHPGRPSVGLQRRQRRETRGDSYRNPRRRSPGHVPTRREAIHRFYGRYPSFRIGRRSARSHARRTSTATVCVCSGRQGRHAQLNEALRRIEIRGPGA